MKLASLISKPVQQIESREMSAKGIIVPFLVTHLLLYLDDKICYLNSAFLDGHIIWTLL